MKFTNYLKDKILYIISGLIFLLFIVLILLLFEINPYIITTISVIYIFFHFIPFILEYYKKNNFYRIFKKSMNSLDKKYFISEFINDANFYEGNILLTSLYEINKNFIESINKYKFTNEEFKEYIELWCHEIKTPISTTKLIIDNNKNNITENIYEEIEKIESFVEQVLFYSRSENVNKDYLISKINIKDIIDNIIKNNKKNILNKKIKINSLKSEVLVESDNKWLTFIFNQIILNSIKYSKDKNAYITIDYKINKNNIIVSVKDNGIGIKSDELGRVFNKGFTGSNGRNKYNSTGFGLYLSKKMCDQLGINIIISSIQNKETIVNLIFPNSSMINLTKM